MPEVSKRAILALSDVTNLELDICEYLVEEIVASECVDELLNDEEQMAEILGEHLVNFGVCESKESAWIVCDKIIKEFERKDVPLDLLYFEGEEEDSDNDEGQIGVCPICTRELPLTFHHLIPKSTHKKMVKQHGYSKEYLNSHGVDLCRPCHSHVHRLIPLMDMALTFNTLERILEHNGVKKWIPYIRKQKITCKSDARVNKVQSRNFQLPAEDLLD